MSLPPEFLKKIESAIEARERRTAGEDVPMPKMHMAIAGPPQSGRKTLATDYLRELDAENLQPSIMATLTIEYLEGFPGERLDEIFRIARDSMLVINNVSRKGPRTAEMDERIEKALQQEGPPLIVLAGNEAYLKKLLKKIQPRDNPVPIAVTKCSFTPEEKAVFEANKGKRKEQLATDREQRRSQRLRQLQNVVMDKPVTALPPIRIVKPPRP